MRIFVSSIQGPQKIGGLTLYEMAGEREAAINTIKVLGHEPIAFEYLRSHPNSSEETYLNELGTSDIVLFMFWQSYSNAVNKEYDEANRLGIPQLVFVKECHEKESRSPQLKLFLNEITTPETGIKYSKFRTQEELSDLIRTSVNEYITNSLRNSTFKKPNAKNLYTGAASIAENSEERLALCQQSLSYIFPNKITNLPTRDNAEQRLSTSLEKWIQGIQNHSSHQLLLLSSVDKTVQEFNRLQVSDQMGVIKRIRYIQKLEKEYPELIRIGWVECYTKDMFVASAGERRFGISIINPINAQPVALLGGSNAEIANAIFSYVKETIMTSKISTDEILSKLEDEMKANMKENH